MNLLYRIYYGDSIVYLGRTTQALDSRLRGHFFAKPMVGHIDINGVTGIEYAECRSVADMYLYEMYYINKLKPPINRGDKARDRLTVSLPDLVWKPYNCSLMEKWITQLTLRQKAAEEARRKETERFAAYKTLRFRHKNGEISYAEFDRLREQLGY